MKKNYLKPLLTILSFFVLQIAAGQNSLLESEHASQISEYLNNNKDKYGLSKNDISDLYVKREFFTKATGITHVYLTQSHQSIQIFNSETSVAIKDGKVFYFANRMMPNISQKINAVTPLVNSADAISKAVSHFNLGSTIGLRPIESTSNTSTLYTKGGVSQADIPVNLVYVLKDNQLKLAWNLSIHTLDGKHWWSVRVDAINNEVIDVSDWILSCDFGHGNHLNHTKVNKKYSKEEPISLLKTNSSLLADGSQYNVFALPTESPSHGSRQLVLDPADAIASPYGWHDDDGSAGAEYTITRGNNVYAWEDRDDNDTPGYSPDGTGSLNFNYALDLNDEPIVYEDAAITNLFYMNNAMHDIWYKYGFDEASGNFQERNYTIVDQTGASDYVNAQAQDGGGTDNANFGTPPDGSNPSMQMFLWVESATPPITVNNGVLAGDYNGISALWALNSYPDDSAPITADVALFTDFLFSGNIDPNDACDPVNFPGNLVGKIVIIRRGNCEFGFKVKAAEDAGAIAVIVVNNEPGFINMGAGVDGDNVTIPAVSMLQADGEAIITELTNNTVNVSLGQDFTYDDGDFDNGIIAHEYGHGISIRLTGGAATTSCLDNAEQMGEGWSDWFGLMITMKPSDIGTDGRGIGTFAINQPTDGSGIRPAKYSTDFAVNGFTYNDTNDTVNISEPHGVGFLWATMLWDLTWAYIDKYGFDADIYNGTGGNNKAMQLVIDGLKLQPCSPGFVDGRNALLAADLATTGGEDQCLIWDVFATRGLGFDATQGDSLSRTDQTEGFVVPDESQVTGASLPTLANCNSLSNEDFNKEDYKIYPNPTNNELFVKVNRNVGKVDLTLTDINGRQVLSKKVDLVGTINLNIGKLQSGIYILNIKGLDININEKIIKN